MPGTTHVHGHYTQPVLRIVLPTVLSKSRDGWSEEELKKLGLDETGGVRQRTRRAANTA